jgi:hypothetical protein
MKTESPKIMSLTDRTNPTPSSEIVNLFLRKIACPGLGLAALLAAPDVLRADYPSQVLADGPITYFRLNENVTLPTFDTATNSGGLGAAGNGLYGGATHSVAGAIVSQPGNAAVSFVASGELSVPFQPGLNVAATFSFEFWAKPADSGTTRCVASSIKVGNSGWLFYNSLTAGQWTFRTISSSSVNNNSTGGTVTVGVYQHVTGVWDGTMNRLYVNGVLVASNTAATTFLPVSDTTVPLTLGGRSDNAFLFSGSVDEAAYYTNALTAGQILAHYQAGTNASPSTPYDQVVQADGPVAYWRLNEPNPGYPMAANIGTLGTAANGAYYNTATNVAGPRPSDFPVFEANNNAIGLDGTSSFMRFPRSGNLTNAGLSSVTSATFLCWVNPAGAQAQYKGLVAMRPLSTGLYLNPDDTLNYAWLDAANTYGFNSGLIPPAGQWSLAAISIQPTQAIFYLVSTNTFASATNAVSHPPADFTSGPFAVGRDINFGGAGRFFNGSIDEAAVFTTALGEGRIRTYFLTAVGDTNPPVLVSDPPTVSPLGTIYSTTTFSITVDAYASSPTFQWRTNGVNIAGATSATYTKANAATSDSGNYDVIVANAHGSVTSSIVAITVNPAVPPTISQQPASRSVYAGGTGSFSVAATGTTPFSYQWKHAGTNLPGATNATLIVASVDATKVGNYSVNVANVAGNVDSATVTLTIRTPAASSYEAATLGLGPFAYWRLDETSGSTAFDFAGGHDGVYSPNVAHVSGALNGDPGDAASFNGTDAFVGTGAGLLNGLTRFSMAGWVRRGGAQLNRTGLFGQNDNVEFGFINDGTIEVWDDVVASAVDTPNPLADGTWGLIVVTSDGTSRTIYVNGQAVASGVGRTAPKTNSFPFNIGGGGIFDNPNANGNWFLGDIDEVALFDKALTADQIQTLYLIGIYGTNSAPLFVQQPVSRTNVVGSTATFSVVAGGSVPLNYQWKRNGTSIPGATAATLSLPNVYFTDVANYSVQVSNGVGTTNSSSATLTVMPVPTFANQTNGLILHLKFDTDYTDSSGRANHAAPVNSPLLIPGKIGSQAVRVNTDAGSATFNYVEVLDTNTFSPYPDLQFAAGDSFSVGYWARYTGLPNDLPIICNAPNSTYQPGWVFSDDGGKLEWTITTAPSGAQVIADPVPGSPLINNGIWHHVLVTFNRDTHRADSYVDGVPVDSRSISGVGNLDTGNGIFLGQDPTGGYGVTGTYDIDDLGIWRRALTSYDALSIYNAGQNSLESFDVYGPVKVYVNLVGTNLDISWQAGTLLQAASVLGPYTPVPSATTPFYRTTATGAARFFRVQQ